MLEFSKDFFEGEERDGFVIEPMMKNAWAANLEVLHKVDRICKEHDIPYFADWGTLLGAVRHHGYIPWDDDIDICMLRKDYQRFCRVIGEYKDEVALLNVNTVEDWGQNADKIINIAAFTVNRAEIKAYHGFPFTAGVDLFVVENLPRDKKCEQEQIDAVKLISAIYYLRCDLKNKEEGSDEYQELSRIEKEALGKIQKLAKISFPEWNPTDQELFILEDEIVSLYGDEDSDYLTHYTCLANGKDYYIPKEVYSTAIEMPFENTTIPVPIGYDYLLRKKYGDDYMTPINIGAGHDYPFYNKAIREVASIKHQDEDEVRRFATKIGTEYYYKFIHKTNILQATFTPTFFEEEIVDGIMVNSTRKKIWAAQIEVYLEVKRLCEKNGINLFVIGDTLQGAVDKNGYLPESEDFHLAIMRSEYMRLMSILQEELDPWFDYRNIYSCEEHEDMRCYVITDGYLCEERDYMQRFHGCECIVGVDISAIDEVSDEGGKEELRKMMIQNLLQTARSMPKAPPYSKEIIDIVKKWQELAPIKIDIKNNLCSEFVKAADTLAGSYRGECKYVRISAGLQEGQDLIYDKTIFCDTIEMEFSTVTVQVPVGYREILGRDDVTV